METHETFLAQLPDGPARQTLTPLFEWIYENFPDLDTTIKWNQPMFTHHGTFIIGFSVAKQHMSIAPEAAAIAQFKAQIVESGYTATDNLFRIKWTQDINYDLLKAIIAFNISDKANCTTFWRK